MKGFEKHRVFFIGIGGIGMSALARWFNANGFDVVGYDKTPTQLTHELLEEGIRVHYKDSIALIPKEFTREDTLVIYTPAIPSQHGQLKYFIANDFEVCKRAEILGKISKAMFTIAVAGTHGKTTTSTMIAYILHASGIDTTAFLGGISTDFGSNLLLSRGNDSVAVVEADEYDRSFLWLQPDITVITSVDPDHLDIYGNEENMLNAFCEFANGRKPGGKLIIADSANKKLNLSDALLYGNQGDVRAENIRINNYKYSFDHVAGDRQIENIQINLPGRHNISNTLAAIIVAQELGVDNAAILKALHDFKGIHRRFEYVINTPGLRFIDDYAHHPQEVTAFMDAIHELYPEEYVLVIFQPHLYSRTSDFADDFAKSLSLADEVILMDIYPARELPMEGVTSALILNKISIEKKQILPREKICDYVATVKPAVVATVGAGNINTLVPELKESLTQTLAA